MDEFQEAMKAVPTDRAAFESAIGPIFALPAGHDGNGVLRDSFFNLFELLRPSVFCDIGANDGSASIEAARLIPQCKVFAFEANPRIHAMHADNIRLDVEWLNIAITDVRGTVQIYAPKTLSRIYSQGGTLISTHHNEPPTTGKSSLLMRDEKATYDQFDVEGWPLDQFFASRQIQFDGRSLFLWIDVEGAGMQVLSGARAALNETQAIFIETEGFEFWRQQKKCDEVIAYLAEHGFCPVARDREFDDAQFNILFVHKEMIKVIQTGLTGSHTALQSIFKPTAHRAATSDSNCSARDKSRYGSISAWLQASVPVLIPCFNNPTYAGAMCKQLEDVGFQEIILVDNASTMDQMRQLLRNLPTSIKVISLNQNFGPHHIFRDEGIMALLPQFFAVTDPDLTFNGRLPDNFLAHLAMLTDRYKVGKAGFALDISDRTQMVDKRFRIGDREWFIWEWEKQFWQRPLGDLEGTDRYYDANLDTTFALYNKAHFNQGNFFSAIRVAGRYTAKHLPWYRDNGLSSDEEIHYRNSQKYSYYLPGVR